MNSKRPELTFRLLGRTVAKTVVLLPAVFGISALVISFIMGLFQITDQASIHLKLGIALVVSIFSVTAALRVRNKWLSFFPYVVLSLVCFAYIFNPGFTPYQAAEIIVNDPKFPVRAHASAVFYGDQFIDQLKKSSDNYRRLNHRSAWTVGKVLSEVDTVRAEEAARELYQYEGVWQRLAGSYALVKKRKFLEVVDDQAFLVRIIRECARERIMDPERSTCSGADSQAAEFSFRILGAGKFGKVLDLMPEVLASDDPRVQEAALVALGSLDDPRSGPFFRRVLEDRQYYPTAAAFIGLLKLGERNAMSLAVQRVDPSSSNGFEQSLVGALEKVTGKRFGTAAEWQIWWKTEEVTWAIPTDLKL